MTSFLSPLTRRSGLICQRLRRVRQSVTLFLLLVLFPTMALAQSGSPFDTGFTALQNLFTGTVAKVASLIAIVIGGYQFAHGDGTLIAETYNQINAYTVCDPFGIAVLDLLVFLADWGRRNLSVSNVNDVIAPPPIARAVAIGASVQRLISD